jgi:hypothetical protein
MSREEGEEKPLKKKWSNLNYIDSEFQKLID